MTYIDTDPVVTGPSQNGQAVGDPRFLEYGVSGLKHAAGSILEEWLPQLQYDRAVKVFREMRDNDPVVGSFLYGIEMLLRDVDWSVKPYDSSPDALMKSEFVDSCMHDMSHTWEDLIAECTSSMPFGWSYHNVVYKRRQGDHPEDPTINSKFDDGLWGWRKIPIRAQETLYRWQFDEEGGTQGMWQRDPVDFSLRYIPIECAALFRTSTHKGNPEGRSVLRNAYRPWWYKKRLEEVEAIGIERDLAGIPKIGLPPEIFLDTATAAQQAVYEAWKKVGQRLRVDDQACIIFPNAYDENSNPLYTVELMSAPGSKQMDTINIIARYRVDIAMSALADVLLLGHERVGTQALAVTKEELFVRSLEAQLDGYASVMNQHVLPRLFRMNGWPVSEMPKIQHSELQSVNLKDFAQVILWLAQAGMPLFPDINLEAKIRTMMELPDADTDASIAEVDDNAGPQGPTALTTPSLSGAASATTSL